MFFSVVIPTFNRADLIGATLESVLGQQHDDWEVVVVDDGSSDATLQVVESYQARFGPRLRVIEQPNSGPGAARNRGIEAARGRYIAFLDSDDLWFPWTLDFYAALLQQHDFPAFLAGAPLIFEDARQWQHALALAQTAPASVETSSVETAVQPAVGTAVEISVEAAVEISAPAARALWFADYLSAGDLWRWFSVSSFVMRRDALGDKRFCALPMNGEDIDFTLQMGVEAGFVDVQAPPTFGYRRHAGSAMSDGARTARGMEFLIAGERAGRYPGGAARRRERLQLLSLHLRPACLEFLQRGTRAVAWRCFGRTLGWHWQLKRGRFVLGFVAQSLKPAPPVAGISAGAARPKVRPWNWGVLRQVKAPSERPLESVMEFTEERS